MGLEVNFYSSRFRARCKRESPRATRSVRERDSFPCARMNCFSGPTATASIVGSGSAKLSIRRTSARPRISFSRTNVAASRSAQASSELCTMAYRMYASATQLFPRRSSTSLSSGEASTLAFSHSRGSTIPEAKGAQDFSGCARELCRIEFDRDSKVEPSLNTPPRIACGHSRLRL